MFIFQNQLFILYSLSGKIILTYVSTCVRSLPVKLVIPYLYKKCCPENTVQSLSIAYSQGLILRKVRYTAICKSYGLFSI